MKVWNPHVESDDEYSTSRVALKTGPINTYEAMESGWAVSFHTINTKQEKSHDHVLLLVIFIDM